MSACVDLMSSNVSVNKEVLKLCARVLEYDLQFWMLYRQLPQELMVVWRFRKEKRWGHKAMYTKTGADPGFQKRGGC